MRASTYITAVALAMAAGFIGCMRQTHHASPAASFDLGDFGGASTEIEYPDVEAMNYADVATTPPPLTLGNSGPRDFWDLPLEDAIHLALKNSKVLRDLGGLVLQSPGNVATIHDPAISETHPQFGVDAALSAFDAVWSTTAFFEKNDRALNNQFFGGGTRTLKQDLFDYTSQLSKRTAGGTDISLRHNMIYDFNNAPGNNNPNLPWSTNLEAEIRQPMLQGAGVQFNRIAGPGGSPGVYNGVLIARVNTDIELADFEIGVRNLVHDVETVYWELYYAYRDLDATIAARDRALETWRIVKALGGRVDADKEAQAREQYYRLEEEVQNALGGRLQERTRQTTFRGTAGVYQNERRLRLLMGVPINDGKLIRPAEEPQMAKIVFDWEDILSEALLRRPEIRRQKWKVKQRELEMIAARNFIRPQLDLIGRWRWRGLGHDLINSDGTGKGQFDNAVDDLLTGDFQEWQVGMEFRYGLGFRQGYAAVRNAELNLAREGAVLDEQQRDVAHDLSSAIAELDRAYLSAKLNYNRRMAAKQQLAALEAKSEGRDIRDRTRYLDLILDAQRRLADAESRYYQSMVEYMLAVKLVHYSKGSLLSYNDIHLAEGAWPEKAYHDAARRARLRMRSWKLTNFVLKDPPVISQGNGGPGMGGPGIPNADLNPNQAGFDHVPEFDIPTPEYTQDYLVPGNVPAEMTATPIPSQISPLPEQPTLHDIEPSPNDPHDYEQAVRQGNASPASYNFRILQSSPRTPNLQRFRQVLPAAPSGAPYRPTGAAPRKASRDMFDANPYATGFDDQQTPRGEYAPPTTKPAGGLRRIGNGLRGSSSNQIEKLPTIERQDLNPHPIGFDHQPSQPTEFFGSEADSFDYHLSD